MIELRNEKIAVPVVLFAGILWSFGPLVVRYMNDPHLVPWQYIFGRGLTIFIILNLYLYFEEGINFYKNYTAISNLIESNLETQMRARSNDDYALSIIDPPFIPELKSKPSRKLILILGTLIGGLLSLLLVMINHYFIKKKYLHT